CQQAYTSPRTF
nr:immunoglobulin light chain junction region [Macaca mulatta]MOW56171.1 immunoglobulin light chain junction region [Macaca mulatta]